MLKKSLFIIYGTIIAIMGAATIVGNTCGGEFAHQYIYGAWWFAAVWALLAAAGTLYFLKSRVRRPAAVALHLSFVVILAGALLTRTTGTRGVIHLRTDETTSTYYAADADAGKLRLPFEVRLDEFLIKFHRGSEAHADYISTLTVFDDTRTETGTASMNNDFTYKAFRFYQTSYDSDMQGSVLTVNHDPWGRNVTYAGYALLFAALVWMLADKRGAFRRALRSSTLKRGVLVVAAAMVTAGAQAATTMPATVADEYGRLYVSYGGRICELHTFAGEFTKKLHGSARYKNYTPEQVVAGFMFYGEEWFDEPIIDLGGSARDIAPDAPRYVSPAEAYAILKSAEKGTICAAGAGTKRSDKAQRRMAEIGDCMILLYALEGGGALKLYPVTTDAETIWCASDEPLPIATTAACCAFMTTTPERLKNELAVRNYAAAERTIRHIAEYQRDNCGDTLPSPLATKAERLLVAVPFATIILTANILFAIMAIVCTIRSAAGTMRKTARRAANVVMLAGMSVSLAALTLCIALRTIVSGTISMQNGYETMLVTAWCVMAAALAAYRRARIVLLFGFVASALFLAVSHMSMMSPQISRVAPVLASPLLGIHVSLVVMSFAMLALTFVCAVTALCIRAAGRGTSVSTERITALQALSRVFLYPATALLAAGIFTGAIWADTAWSAYWSWDAKEVWALITLMVYAVPMHTRTVTALEKPVAYHTFMAAAFATIIMTYFGVNYLLGGLHSYA